MMTTRTTFLPFALPSISEDAIFEVSEVLKSGWVTSGPKTKEFEHKFGEFLGGVDSIAVSSATAGLHLALDALGLDSSHAILTSSVTFTATTEVACYMGATPILSDVDPNTHLMTPELARKALERECYLKNGKYYTKSEDKWVRVILPVHLAGYTSDMEGFIDLAREHSMYIVEDAAHAFPASHKNKPIGRWGDITVFSFYATKGITTGEGGMVTTSLTEVSEKIKKTRLHGINKDSYNRPSWFYEVVDAGYKYNLSDIQSALGVAQLREANNFWNRRKEIALKYIDAFSDITGLSLPPDDPMGLHSWHLFRITIDPQKAKVGRDTLCEELKERKIGSSLHFIPIYEHSFYRTKFKYNREDYPNANKMYSQVLSIPLFAGMKNEDVDDVIRAVRESLT